MRRSVGPARFPPRGIGTNRELPCSYPPFIVAFLKRKHRNGEGARLRSEPLPLWRGRFLRCQGAYVPRVVPPVAPIDDAIRADSITDLGPPLCGQSTLGGIQSLQRTTARGRRIVRACASRPAILSAACDYFQPIFDPDLVWSKYSCGAAVVPE